MPLLRVHMRFDDRHVVRPRTPMIRDLLDEQGDQPPDVVRTPMGRAGRADEVAPAMLFLAGEGPRSSPEPSSSSTAGSSRTDNDPAPTPAITPVAGAVR